MAKLLHVVLDSGVHHWINPNSVVRISHVSSSPNLWSVVLQEGTGLTFVINVDKFEENRHFIDEMVK